MRSTAGINQWSASSVGTVKCRVCGAADPERKRVTFAPLERTVAIRRCANCGYVAIPGNREDYTQLHDVSDLRSANRCGTEERPGREHGMAKVAVHALGRDRLTVLVYGAGRSLDNQHIAKLPAVERVVIGDIMRVRPEVDFVDTSKAATERFDVVVASEVIEHFIRPRADFRGLFGFVAPDGILICSTNINDGTPIRRTRYPFMPGHTSYYTPRALRHIAEENGMNLDFRAPRSAAGGAGPRKRYVIFSPSAQVMAAVADYFGSHLYAPSEPSDGSGSADS